MTAIIWYSNIRLNSWNWPLTDWQSVVAVVLVSAAD